MLMNEIEHETGLTGISSFHAGLDFVLCRTISSMVLACSLLRK